MNANVPAEQRKANVPALVAGGNVAALIPHSLEEAFRVATAIAQSGLAPRGLDRQEQILVAIMAGAELGLAPFQALQSFAVVNGRPTLWGDGLMAVARSGGVKVKEWVEGEGEAAVAHCEVTRPEGEVIARSFSVAQAKKAGLWGKQGPWQAYPTRMLAMRARAYALRDGCADMLRGFQVREEVEDYEVTRDVTPRKGTGMRARLEARSQVVEPNGGFDPEHVEAELSGEPVADAEFTEDDDELSPCDACGAAAGVECADNCSSWDDLDPSGWPESVRAARATTADDFPGDRPAGPDVRTWAEALEASLQDYAGVDVMRADWNARKQELHDADLTLFKRVNQAIARRAAEMADADA